MTRYAFASMLICARRMLAIVIAAVAITGAGYVGEHPFSNPWHLAPFQRCPVPSYPRGFSPEIKVPPCHLPSRFFWQIPAGALLGLAGLGLGVLVAGPRRPKHRLPCGVSHGRLARI